MMMQAGGGQGGLTDWSGHSSTPDARHRLDLHGGALLGLVEGLDVRVRNIKRIRHILGKHWGRDILRSVGEDYKGIFIEHSVGFVTHGSIWRHCGTAANPMHATIPLSARIQSPA